MPNEQLGYNINQLRKNENKNKLIFNLVQMTTHKIIWQMSNLVIRLLLSILLCG